MEDNFTLRYTGITPEQEFKYAYDGTRFIIEYPDLPLTPILLIQRAFDIAHSSHERGRRIVNGRDPVATALHDSLVARGWLTAETLV